MRHTWRRGESNLCEATRTEIATVTVESLSRDGPFRLCEAAAQRLENFTLRPLEWFHLAAKYGYWEPLLHDDLYSQDGEAMQPGEDVQEADLFPCPTLDDCGADPAMLLDYAFTRWDFEPEVIAALRSQGKAMMPLIEYRAAQTRDHDIRSHLASIAGYAVGEDAAAWLRALLTKCESAERVDLLRAGRACLPAHEALERTKSALAALPSKERVKLCLTLAYFQDASVLDWIEEHVCEPITFSWGALAAISQLDWARAKKWIDGGRPLSLIALDALLTCEDPGQSQYPLIRRYMPWLRHPATKEEVTRTLLTCLAQDDVPRTEEAVKCLIKHVDGLVNPKHKPC